MSRNKHKQTTFHVIRVYEEEEGRRGGAGHLLCMKRLANFGCTQGQVIFNNFDLTQLEFEFRRGVPGHIVPFIMYHSCTCIGWIHPSQSWKNVSGVCLIVNRGCYCTPWLWLLTAVFLLNHLQLGNFNDLQRSPNIEAHRERGFHLHGFLCSSGCYCST